MYDRAGLGFSDRGYKVVLACTHTTYFQSTYMYQYVILPELPNYLSLAAIRISCVEYREIVLLLVLPYSG